MITLNFLSYSYLRRFWGKSQRSQTLTSRRVCTYVVWRAAQTNSQCSHQTPLFRGKPDAFFHPRRGRVLCTLVSPNSWDHSDGLASARKLHVVTCNFFRALWLLVKKCTPCQGVVWSLYGLTGTFYFPLVCGVVLNAK